MVIGCPAAAYGVNFHAPGTGKTVALTFDDGPGLSTQQIMAVLAAHGVTATFFNLGQNEAGAAATVLAMYRDGYALGCHTWDHASLPDLDAAGQAGEMDRERAEQGAITGHYPCLFRPPYGNYDATTLELAQARGMTVWYWSIDTEDWKAAGSADQYWVDRVVARATDSAGQDHPVILMHNQPGGNPATVAALPRIISYYHDHGYTFVDLSGHARPPSNAPAEPYPPGTTAMKAGQQLLPGQHLVAADRLSALQMQPDGNLVLSHTGGGASARYAIWQSLTHAAGSHLSLQSDGNLVIYSPAGQAKWNTRTGGHGPHVDLLLRTDGNAVLSDGATVIWQSHTARYKLVPVAAAQPFPAAPSTLAAGTTLPAGGTLVSPNRLTQVAMQGDGNLVVEHTGDGTTSRYVLWSAHTHSPGARLSMQGDGNLVIYTTAGTAVWNTHTNGSGSDPRLNMQDDGNLVLYAGGHARWQSATAYFLV